jgi:hypothetical protein
MNRGVYIASSIILLLSVILMTVLLILEIKKSSDCKGSESPRCPDYVCGSTPDSTDKACQGKYEKFPPYRTGKSGKTVCRTGLLKGSVNYS